MTAQIKDFAAACDWLLYTVNEVEHARLALDQGEPLASQRYYEAVRKHADAAETYWTLRTSLQELIDDHAP